MTQPKVDKPKKEYQITCKFCSGSTEAHTCKHCGAVITEEYAKKWRDKPKVDNKRVEEVEGKLLYLSYKHDNEITLAIDDIVKLFIQTQQETLNKVIEIITDQYVDEENPYTKYMSINDTLDFLVAKINRLKTIKKKMGGGK